jgi:hypothetical protein
MMDFEQLWMRQNNLGRGFPVGAPSGTIEDAVENEGWQIIEIIKSGYDEEMIIAKKNDGKIVGVCNAHGPWACELESDY